SISRAWASWSGLRRNAVGRRGAISSWAFAASTAAIRRRSGSARRLVSITSAPRHTACRSRAWLRHRRRWGELFPAGQREQFECLAHAALIVGQGGKGLV